MINMSLIGFDLHNIKTICKLIVVTHPQIVKIYPLHRDSSHCFSFCAFAGSFQRLSELVSDIYGGTEFNCLSLSLLSHDDELIILAQDVIPVHPCPNTVTDALGSLGLRALE